MIIFDSNYLIAFLRPDVKQPPRDADNKPVEHFKERIQELVNDLNSKDVLVGIPTPVIAEILVRYPDNKSEYLEILRNRYKFDVMPFGIKAAIEASELIALLVAETKQPAEQWAKVKFDIQIVAMAKAEESLTMLYADDKGVVNNAKRLKIPVTRICELPLPTFRPVPVPMEDALGQNLLFEHRENDDAATTTEHSKSLTGKENNQFQGDPPHSTSVQVTNGGPAQGEAEGEASKESDGKEDVGVDLSSLPERICGLYRDGKLPTPFGTEHVVELLKGEFADTYLRTVLANYCEETGDYVKKGQKAWFRRISEGRYEIL